MGPDDIRRFRTTIGLTQEQLATLLGVHTLTVSRWERGQAKPDGATAQLLGLLLERSAKAKPPASLTSKVLGAIAGGAAIAGLGLLLAHLLKGEDK